MSDSIIKAYRLGDIAVEISETDKENKLLVDCNDGEFHSSFTVSRYEYNNYKRHMNQRIKDAFNKGRREEE